MRYLVGYDISDDKRRDRVATALLDFGQRLEESFVSGLRGIGKVQGINGPAFNLAGDGPVDRIHVIPVCDACWRKSVTFGVAHLPEEPEFYVL